MQSRDFGSVLVLMACHISTVQSNLLQIIHSTLKHIKMMYPNSETIFTENDHKRTNFSVVDNCDAHQSEPTAKRVCGNKSTTKDPFAPVQFVGDKGAAARTSIALAHVSVDGVLIGAIHHSASAAASTLTRDFQIAVSQSTITRRLMSSDFTEQKLLPLKQVHVKIIHSYLRRATPEEIANAGPDFGPKYVGKTVQRPIHKLVPRADGGVDRIWFVNREEATNSIKDKHPKAAASKIGEVANGKRRSAYGYVWENASPRV